uniref:Putative flocculation protein flo11 n=1 Tax=Rhipicephalus microplus TaxID=6941 RepID=A0A6M2D1D3_RHIMP
MLLMGDDSILVAATQEVDVSSPARKYSKTPTGANKGQLSSLGRSTVSILDVGSPTTLKTPPLASPVHRKEGRSTPNWNMGATRRSPRLSILSSKRTPSPMRVSSAKTKKPAELVTRAVPANPGEVSKRVEPAKTAATVETAASGKTVELEKTVELAPAIQASSRTSSTDLLFEDDDEDELLDQICCTYEQQQQLDAKMAAAASASLSKMSTSSPVTTSRSTTLTFQSATVVPSVASKTTALLISEAEAPKATVIKSSVSTTSVRQIDQSNGGLKNVAAPTRPLSLRATVSKSAIKQSTGSTSKPGLLPLSNTTNQPKQVSAHTCSFQQARVILEQCVAASAKAPPLGKEQSPSSALVSTAPKLRLSTKSPLEKSSLGTSPPQSTIVKTSSKSVDAALDFDDDDLDLATPEVMSWLEEVESQPVLVKRCTPEEIAKKRAEALRRRRLREQESNMWKGRLRMSK